MEQLTNSYRDNVAYLDGALGVGRSVDMVARDYVVAGRRARLYVVDGYGKDETLERMGAFWLSLTREESASLTEMQDFADRYITFSETDVEDRLEALVNAVLMGKTLFIVEGLRGAALIDC